MPTVVYAHTISGYTQTCNSAPQVVWANFCVKNSDVMLSQMLSENMGDLVVTPKDVDIMIDNISGIIADGINLAVHNNVSLDEIRTFLH